ncbi:glycosyltransferase [Dehalogenimonas etheniformans]|uniref:Glycosyltransferase family 2 protein n=1 Tax=Dehalogenimonas etheniformans TaxID=1536648 RepID=A0A2P5P9P6_9CHLR|nr:glycosyltransferase family 2 protein [Dehalogenimonas etheniformans]PPD59007.1 glycosyltransferase family 2 protein [Dehalogenimonas etheniformans]QNT76225.1 glycosyltransferase family 2 protein [Dehalogenimonas etheniformans]
MTKPHLTIVIPSYKEAANIPSLLEKIHSALGDYPYDVLVIDDNSPDGTAEVARGLAEKYPVSVVVRKDKRGLASAVVDGFKLAGGDIVAVMDADLQHPPEVLPRLVRAIEGGADLAVASRYVPGGSVGNWSATRRVISRGAVLMSHVLLPSTRGIKDPMSGYFMLRKDVISEVALSPVGYKILLEVICLGCPRTTVEVPFIFENRRAGVTKLSMITQTDYLRHLLSLMRRTGELNRIVKFVAVGGSGTLVNLGLLAILKEWAGLYYLVAGAIAFEVSVVWNFLLNDRFTFGDRKRPEGTFLGRLLRFNVTSLGGFIIYIGILALLTQVFGLFYIISAAIGIVVGFGWNFMVNSAWTWR